MRRKALRQPNKNLNRRKRLRLPQATIRRRLKVRRHKFNWSANFFSAFNTQLSTLNYFMAEITAATVGKLREMTGAGLMDCKKALVESKGDLDAAGDILRKKGIASAAKKADRAANEGV